MESQLSMKICTISGNRADISALTPVAQAVGAHWIFVDTLPSRDRHDSAISCGQAMMMAADQLEQLHPDLVILGGDRFEILGAACAAHLMSIPIAHLSGGDITEGSQDDSTRHAISKLAAIHFPTNQDSADRLLAMGEEEWRVHMVGAPQIDYLLNKPLYSRDETLKRLSVISGAFILVAYQPATGLADPLTECLQLLAELRDNPLPKIFASINTDAGGLEVGQLIYRFCRPGIDQILMMDQKLYLSAMKHCEYMIGNSSSGFYEAPTLGIKFINFGARQTGRTPVTGDGKAAERIKVSLDALMQVPKQVLLQKRLKCSTPTGNGSTVNGNGESIQKRNLSDGPVETPYQEHEYLTLDQGKEVARGS